MLDIAVWQYGGEGLTLPLRHTAIQPYRSDYTFSLCQHTEIDQGFTDGRLSWVAVNKHATANWSRLEHTLGQIKKIVWNGVRERNIKETRKRWTAGDAFPILWIRSCTGSPTVRPNLWRRFVATRLWTSYKSHFILDLIYFVRSRFSLSFVLKYYCRPFAWQERAILVMS